MDSETADSPSSRPSFLSVFLRSRDDGLTYIGLFFCLAVFAFIGACGDPSSPVAPGNLSIVTGEGGYVDTDGIFTAYWDASASYVDYYDVEYSTDGTTWEPLVGGVTNTSFSAITLQSGQYFYRFRTCYEGSCSPWSETVSINVNLYSTAQALASNSPFDIYRGHINSDGVEDLYLHYPDDLVVLHSVSGSSAAPVVMPSGQTSYWLQGLQGGGFLDPTPPLPPVAPVDINDLAGVGGAQLLDYNGDGVPDLFVDLSNGGSGNLVFNLVNGVPQLLASDVNYQQVAATATVAIDPDAGVTTGDTYFGVLRGDYSVNADGSFSYNVPIQVPPGINGMQPNIALTYNSNRRNGVVGWGWALGGQSMVSRCRATMLKDGHPSSINNGSDYKFCLDGQRLVEIAPGEYRTEVESFRVIKTEGGTAKVPSGWTVTMNDGDVYTYGNLVAGQNTGPNNAKVFDGSGDTQQWYLRKKQDVVGNAMTYHYDSTIATGEHRISHIEYTQNAAGSINHRVVFEYEARLDIRSGYRANQLYTTNQRLKHIVTRVNTLQGDLLSGTQVGRYTLEYQQPVANDTNYNDPVSTSRVETITRCFANDNECAEPLVLAWEDVKTINDGEWLNLVDNVHYSDFNGDGMLDAMAMFDEIQCINFDVLLSFDEIEQCAVPGADGFNIFVTYGLEKLQPDTDLAAFTKNLTARLGNPATREVAVANINTNHYPGISQWFRYPAHSYGIADFNGDGLDDIWVWWNPLYNNHSILLDVYLATGVPAESGLEKFTHSSGYSYDTGSQKHLPAFRDMNGDGLIDVIWMASDPASASTATVLKLNNGTGFTDVQAPTAWIGDPSSLVHGGSSRNIHDFNADGLPDVKGHQINTGYGFSLDNVTDPSLSVIHGEADYNFEFSNTDWSDAGCTPSHSIVAETKPIFQATRPRGLMRSPDLGDFNGDGHVDALLQCEEGVFVALGRGDLATTPQNWAPMGVVSHFVEKSNQDFPFDHKYRAYRMAPLIADVNNDGYADVVNSVTREVWFSDSKKFVGPYQVFGDANAFSERFRLTVSDYGNLKGQPIATKPLSLIDINGDGLIEVKNKGSYSKFQLQWFNTTDQTTYPYTSAIVTAMGTSGVSPFGGDHIVVRETVNRLGGHKLLQVQMGHDYVISVDSSPINQGDFYQSGSFGVDGNRVQFGNVFDIHTVSENLSYNAFGAEPVDLDAKSDSGLIAVQSITVDNGLGQSLVTRYDYANNRRHLGGFGNLGFASRSETTTKLDADGALKTMHSVTEYYQVVKDTDTDPELYSLAGRPKRELLYTGPDGATDVCSPTVTTNCLKLLSETRYQWKVRTYLDDIDPLVDTTGDDNGDTQFYSPHYYPYVYATTTQSYDLISGNLVSTSRTDNARISSHSCAMIPDTVLDGTDPILEATNDAAFDYHPDGVMLSSRSTTCDERASAHAVTGSLQAVDASTIITQGNARGLVQDRTQTAATGVNVSGLATRSRRQSYTYSTLGQLLTESSGLNGTTAEQRTSTFVYNGYGSAASITENWGSEINDGLNGFNSRLSSVNETYASNGQRTVVTTNALNQTTTSVFDGRFGVPIHQTDINGLITQTSYDTQGRATLVNYPDGTQTENRYRACNDCFAYSDHEQWYAYSKTTGLSAARMVYDGLGRELGSEAINLTGDTVYQYNTFDVYNRAVKAVDPFFAFDTQYDTQFSYDLLDRPVLTTFTDGSTQTVTRNGTSEFITNREGQQLERYYNHAGWVTQSIDNDDTPVDFTYYPFGDLKTTQVNNNAATLVQLQYDNLGRKTELDDPNTGVINYQYNPLGLLASETDAKVQVTRYQYDKLGRQVERIDDADSAVFAVADLATRTHVWAYDAATNGAGQLASLSGFDTRGIAYSETYTYTALSLPESTVVNYESRIDTVTSHYDDFSRPLATVYPTGYTTANVYNGFGFLFEVKDALNDNLLWKANTQDARGNITQSTLGNGVVTNSSYQPDTGRISTIQAQGNGVTVQNHSYTFSAMGNLTQREDIASAVTQHFCYDTMNRLRVTSPTACSAGTPSNTTYDALGNILTHSNGLGAYSYGNNAGPHAVTGVGTKTYLYDANGNLKQSNDGFGEEKKVHYSAFNKPTYFQRGAVMGGLDHSTLIDYGPHKSRVKREESNGKVTRYVGGVYETNEHNGELEQVHYIGDFALFVLKSGATASADTVYQHRDHIGSIVARTTSTLSIIDDVESMANDPWGNREDGYWGNTKSGTSFVPNYTARGFTDHEHLDGVGFIHMNGRVYDPEIGRFLSPDPMVQAPNNTQSYNRYSYVMNNPLSFTDPTGYEREISGEVEVTANRPSSSVDGGTALMSTPGGGIGSVAGNAAAGAGAAGVFDNAAQDITDAFSIQKNRKAAQKLTDKDGKIRVYGKDGFRKLTGREKAAGKVKVGHQVHIVSSLTTVGAQQQGKPTRGEAVKYHAAISPGIGFKIKGFGVEITALNINLAEGIEGNLAGDNNPFVEGNLTLLEIKLGQYAFNIGISTHAKLTGDGNSEFVPGPDFGLSRGNASSNFSTFGFSINPGFVKFGGSVDFGTLVDSFTDE